MKKQLNYQSQGRRSVFCIGRANKQAPETLTCRGFWGNSPIEILKVGNATFQHSRRDIRNEMTDVLLLICYFIHM